MADPLDLVRAFYEAVNRADYDALAALYHPDAIAEQIFTDDDHVFEGRQAIVAGWRKDLKRHPASQPDGMRVAVVRIEGIEPGWGWVRAEWTARTRRGPAAPEQVRTGRTHFWIEGGLIRRQRSAPADAAPPNLPATEASGNPAPGRREY